MKTLYSGISAGTELTAFLGTNPFLHRRWDAQRRLFGAGDASLTYPLVGWGYEQVGEVVELAADVTSVSVGDRAWGIWGHRSDGILSAQMAAAQTIPASADVRVGVFARVGAVSLNAVIEADIHPGETVAVFGQGVIGLLTTQLARVNGADVVAVDRTAERLEVAKRLGAERVVRSPEEDAAGIVRDLTDGRGADVCIELSGAYPALHEAIRTACYGGRVVAAGFYQGDATGLRLGEEFHHNRVELVGSQISGVPARYAHRWTSDRLHREFMQLAVDGRVDPVALISHTLPAAQVQRAFEAIAAGDPSTLQVLLDFTEETL
jgi:2-desacetyl-2-hydroxyethyl bacteriochlorophyllide A dehydrogenase